jgi:hypothetical protein
MHGALLALALLIGPAAGGWGHYNNARFGFSIDVPPGFAVQGESANGDGNTFTTPTAELRAFAGNIVERDFESEVRGEQGAVTDEGFAITYQATTPQWASFSGKHGGRIVYGRLVAICHDQFMGFVLEYSAADIAKFNPIVDRLVSSLRGPRSC